MRRRAGSLLWVLLCVAVLLLLALPGRTSATTAVPQQGDTTLGDVTVVVEPMSSSVVLGDDLALQITVANGGAAATDPMVLHLDILDRNNEGSVDPEDWTSTLTRPIAEIPAGGSTDVSWTVQPISAGTFIAYAVVVKPSGTGLTASNLAEVMVEDRRSLNPGNILPLAIGAPLVVGGALALQLGLGRRSGRDGRRTVGVEGSTGGSST